MSSTLFGEMVAWSRTGPDTWTGTGSTGRLWVEYLPMFDVWQWSTERRTGQAPDRVSAQCAAEAAEA